MLYNVLTEQDKNTIESYIVAYGASNDSSTQGCMAELSHLLRFWEVGKEEYLYKALGEKLIIEKEITYAQPENQLRQALSQSMNYGKMHGFYYLCNQKMMDIFSLWSEDYGAYCRLFSEVNLAHNSLEAYPYGPRELIFSDGQKVKLVYGAKPIKILGKIAKVLNLEKEFEEFRLEHSLILNQKKITGTLCLSIHPMDYLTMSDNCSGWSSCMSWREDGAYRMGTVEMMNSPMVVVAYMKNDDTIDWSNHKWNNKKWRTLMVVNSDIITTIKSYPYYNEEFSKNCVEWMRELVNTNLGWDFPHEVSTWNGDCTFEYIDGNTYYINTNTYRMYNDFGCCDYHYVSLANRPKTEGLIHIGFTYSGPTECMWCGGTSYFFDEENFVFCEDCSDGGSYYQYCDHCGERHSDDDMTWINDVPICYECIHEVAEECEITGDWYFKEDMVNIYLTRTNDVVEPDNNRCIRAGNYVTENDSAYSHICYCLPHQTEDGIYYWNIEDLSLRALDYWFFLRNWEAVEEYRSQD